MFDAIDRMMMAGLGAMSMTRERAEKIFDEYVKRGRAEKASKTGFVREMMDMADSTRADFEKMVSEQVDKAVGKAGVARHEDVERIEKKLDELLSRE